MPDMSAMRTPRTLSPYLLVQEFLRDEPWQLLCACILLNQSTAKSVWKILPEFLDRYPDGERLLMAPHEEVADLLRPTGLYNVKTKRLRSMTEKYLTGGWTEPEDLPGVGRYAADSYNMFFRGRIVEDVEDKELKNYLLWSKMKDF